MAIVRFLDRPILDVHEGDEFSLDNGKTWYVFVGRVVGPVSVLIHAEDDESFCISLGFVCRVKVEFVKVKIGDTLLVDVTRWSREYSIARNAKDVASDVREYFSIDHIIPDHVRHAVRPYVVGMDM